MTICTVYIVSFYANITKIGTHSYLFNQNPTKKVILLDKKLFYLGVANGYLSRVLNTVIADTIVMIKIT